MGAAGEARTAKREAGSAQRAASSKEGVLVLPYADRKLRPRDSWVKWRTGRWADKQPQDPEMTWSWDPFLVLTLKSSTQQHLTTQKITTDWKASFLLYFSIASVLKRLPNLRIFFSVWVKFLTHTHTHTPSFYDTHIPELTTHSGELNYRLPQNLLAASRIPGPGMPFLFKSQSGFNLLVNVFRQTTPGSPCNHEANFSADNHLQLVTLWPKCSCSLFISHYSERASREWFANFYGYPYFPHTRKCVCTWGKVGS